MTSIYRKNIIKVTKSNQSYRKVVHTSKQQQTVVMSLINNEDIPSEIHPKTTQFIQVVSGRGVAIIGRNKYRLTSGSTLIIPPGKQHTIEVTSKTPLKLFTVYSPPEHPKNLIQHSQKKTSRNVE